MRGLLLVVSWFISFFLVSSAQAQEFDFTKAYQDYIYNQTIYEQAYSAYDEAKNSYLKNQTLTLKEEARKKTYTMLVARDELLRVYLTAIRIKLIENRALVDSKLDEEIAWYEAHRASYKADDALDKLFIKSKEAESRFNTKTLPIAYESLFNISYTEIENIRRAHEEVYKSMKNSIDLGVSRGILRLDPFNRWFVDIEGVLNDLDTITLKSKAKIAKMYEGSTIEPKSTFTGAINELTPAITKLVGLNNFLTELLNSINAQLTQNQLNYESGNSF